MHGGLVHSGFEGIVVVVWSGVVRIGLIGLGAGFVVL